MIENDNCDFACMCVMCSYVVLFSAYIIWILDAAELGALAVCQKLTCCVRYDNYEQC